MLNYNIHVRQIEERCCDLKVHDSLMKRKDSEVSCCDVVCSSGRNDKSIQSKSRSRSGEPNVSKLNQVSLGYFFYIIAFTFVPSNFNFYISTQLKVHKKDSIDLELSDDKEITIFVGQIF